MLPEFNNRPQLWSRLDYRGLRIIYPDGRVKRFLRITWSGERNVWEWEDDWYKGMSQKEAITRCIMEDVELYCSPPEFLGYLRS